MSTRRFGIQHIQQRLHAKLLSRNAPIGRHYIGGTDADRDQFERFKGQLYARQVAPRRRLAAYFQGLPTAFIDSDKGYAVFGPDHFAEGAEAAAAARRVAAFLDSDESAPGVKPQLYSRLLDHRALTLDAPYLRFILRPDVLQAVSAYLGVVPILSDVDVWHSVHSGQAAFANSQLWHSDWEAVRQIKVFLYADAVAPANGPLVLLDAATSEEVRERVGYTYFNQRPASDVCGRIPDATVDALIGSNHRYVVTGPAGTVAFVDTGRCLHYGSRVQRQTQRTLVYYQFLPPTAFNEPLNPRKKRPFRHLDRAGLSPLQRMVLGADA